MQSDGDIVVRGVAIEPATSRLVGVAIAWYRELGRAEIEVDGRDRAVPWPFPEGTVERFAALLFDPVPGGGERDRPVDPVADPVNIDGSPRNKIRDKIARLRIEGLAAD